MKKRIMLILFAVLLVFTLVGPPVLAKEPDKGASGVPFQDLSDAVEELQQQIEDAIENLQLDMEDLMTEVQNYIDTQLADIDMVIQGMVEDALAALQGQIDLIDAEVAQLKADLENIEWNDINNVPADFADGVDGVGITSETDPTVPENLKDGVSWTEIANIPPGFADGTDDGGGGGSLKHLVNDFIVASEQSITAGDVVTFLDGFVQKGHFQGDEISIGSGYAFHLASTRGLSAAALSETIFVVVYKDWDSFYYNTAIVGEITGNTITYGSESVFCSSGASFDNLAPEVASLSPTQFVVAYKDPGNSDYGTARIGTVTGTDITFGSTCVFNTAVTYHLSISAVSEDKFVVAYQDAGNSWYGTAIIGTVSGSNITFGSEHVYNPDGSYYNSVSSLSEAKFVVAYQDGDGTAIIGEVSGDAITFGSEYEFNADETRYISVTALSGSQFVVTYEDDGNSDYGTAIIGDVSGNSIAFGTEQVFNTASSWYISITAMSPDKFVITYSDKGNSDHGTAIVGDVSGNSIAFGSEYSFHSADASYISVTGLSDNQFVVAYMDPGSSFSFYGIAKIGDVASRGNVIGIAKATAAEGEAVPVIITGVSDVHSGLVTGETYFATTSGDLTSSVTDYRIGFAVSESELLLAIPIP